MASVLLQEYWESYENVQGWFLRDAQVVWDFLLDAQENMGIHNDYLEIGVWQGKSALLGALHLQPGESIVLIDIGKIEEARQKIQELLLSKGSKEDAGSIANRIHFFQGESCEFYRSHKLMSHSQFRWIHIDADHKGYSTLVDLEIAKATLGKMGILCVDDFFSFRYPQLTAAVFHFLEKNPQFKLFLCGSNKCYICHTSDYVKYESIIRNRLYDYMNSSACNITLAKTSYIHDHHGCFSIINKIYGKSVVGLDEDVAFIPF